MTVSKNDMTRIGLKLAIVMTAMLAIAGCKREDKKPQAAAPAERPPARVTAVAAIAKDVPVYLDEIGKTISIDTVAIVPQVGGKLLAAHIDDGADVKKGQLLFEIDPRPFEAALASAKAVWSQSKAELDWATIEYSRVKSLEGTSAISQQEIDQKKNALEIAAAKIQAGEALVDAAKLNLDYTKISSPIDGRAGARLVVPGNIVKANDVALLVIQRLDPIYAEFTITENDLGTVRKYLAGHGLDLGRSPEKGLKVEVDVPADSTKMISALGPVEKPSTQPATSPTAPPREGALTFLDNTVQGTSGTVRVRATVANADYYFWPGQFVRVRLVLTTKKDAVLIPAQAQQIGQQGPFVYVVASDGTADQRQIVPGQRQGNFLVVESGVKAGEQVIVTGQMLVMPKGKVEVINAAQNPSAVSMAK